MKSIGKLLTVLVMLALATASNIALAAVQANLDRDRIVLGDTLRLTITATEDEDLDDAMLNPLNADFEILQRTNSSNTSLVNGRLFQSRQLVLELTPIREGNLQIPSLQVGASSTAVIPVVVSSAPTTHAGGETVLFEAEVDQHDLYVQGQLILTLRVQQSVSLERRSISELKLDNAFVKPLEQHSFQRTINGRQWLVDEVRYAVFPEQSGTLEIPAQVFSGRLTQPRRSLFDRGGSGQLVRRSTPPISINVLPKPADVSADTWLPVRDLQLEETWSTPPDTLSVGESVTRTIRILGEGAQGAQLPPILFTPIDGLKYYPDQPQISEQEVSSGLMGQRLDSAALVPTRIGSYLIPEVRIPWWDTQTKKIRYAVLPEHKITVAAGQSADSLSGELLPSPTVNTNPVAAGNDSTVPWWGKSFLWPVLAAASTLGWLLTLVYFQRQRHSKASKKAVEPDNSAEKKVYKQLLANCMAGDASAARSTLINWAASTNPDSPPVSLEQVARLFPDEALTRELKSLNSHLYSPEQDSWSGSNLADCLRRVRNASGRSNRHLQDKLRLYPEH